MFVYFNQVLNGGGLTVKNVSLFILFAFILHINMNKAQSAMCFPWFPHSGVATLFQSDLLFSSKSVNCNNSFEQLSLF